MCSLYYRVSDYVIAFMQELKILKLFKTMSILFIVCLCYANSLSAAPAHYTLTFDQSLKSVQVTIELTKSLGSIKARNSYSALFIDKPVDCESGEIVSFRDSRLYLHADTRCITYSMHLNQKQDRRPFNFDSQTMVTTPAEWLFLPRLGRNESIRVTVIKNKQHELSVPWQPIDEATIDENKSVYELRASPESADGLVIVGNFVRKDIQHKGTRLRVAYLPGKKIDLVALDAWLKQTVNNISLVYGRFPHPSPQIIVSPTASSWSRHKSPVPFGRVVRDYGESVQFFIDQRQSLNAFNKDWTATHEFSHLLLPYISWKNRWISEGFASYYQNILMARSGMYSERRAWQKLYEGFMRGKKSAPELSPNSAAREGWGGTMKVYWSGAALAFLADVRLRKATNNTKSLDTTLEALQKCCLPSSRTWSGSRFMRKLDQLSESKVFSELYNEYANNSRFVPFEEGFSELGIVVRNGKVRLSDDEEFRLVRETIIKP